MKGQSRVRVLALVLADVATTIAVWMAVILAYQAFWGAHYWHGVGFYWRMWPIVPAFVALNACFRLYHGRGFYPAVPLSPVEELRRLFVSSFITHIGAIAIIVLMRQTMQDYSRLAIVLSGALIPVLAQFVRDTIRVILLKTGLGQIPVVLLGPDAAVRRFADMLRCDAYLGLRPSAHADVAVVCGDIGSFRADLPELSKRFVAVNFILETAALPIVCARTVSFDGLGGIEIANQRLMWGLRCEKWLLDKFCSVLAFALTSPLFVVIPILIKLTSRGPVFYRQRRLGRDGREIRVWKFRSMYADADARLAKILADDPALAEEWRSLHKLAKDPRVTPLGRFLRKTSLDEIPQLFNVFGGSMALVGPRPIVKEEVGFYGDTYDIFSSVKPGVTGLWQVSGRSDTDYARRVVLDVQYVLNWSPWMDLWILLRTPFAVLGMKGAR